MAHSGKTITFGTDLFPQEDNIYKLGSSDKKWNLYANQISGLNKFNAIITGSGTTAVTSGTKMPALWRFNLGIASPSEGDIVTIKIPVAGHGNGVFVSLDNGTTYYPVSVSGTSLLTTHYKANQIISLVCVGSGGTNAIYPAQATINGNSYTLGTSTDITGKHWCVLNYYDSGNTNTLMRTYALSTTTSLPLLAGMTDTEGNWTNYTSSYKALYGAISSTDTDRPTIDLPTGHITVPGGITGDLTGNAKTATTASFIGKGSHTAAITANEFTPAAGTLTVLGNVSNTSMPDKTNNANAEVIVKAHPTSGTNYYEARLGFNSNGNLYHMPVNGDSWKTLLDSNNYSSYALPLSGGEVTGRIYKQGTACSWHKGRDYAVVAVSTANAYSPLASMKTTNGSWEIGTYNNASFTDDLLFTYITDTLYGGTSASTSAQIRFLEDGGALFGGIIQTSSGGIWVQGGSESGGNNTRMALTSGMPDKMPYNGKKRGTFIYSNGIAFADPYNGNSNNDAGWIRHIEETANTGTLEIGVGDDNANEQVVVRRYNTSNAVGKEIKLFDASGNSSFPGDLSVTGGITATAWIYSKKAGPGICIIDTNSTRTDNSYRMNLTIAADGCQGIWSSGYSNADKTTFTTANKWLIYRSTDGDTYLPGAVHITGTASSNPLNVRGISGCAETGLRGANATSSDQGLYLNYTGGPVMIGYADATATNQLYVQYTGDASSTSTGALRVDGGVGIAKKLYVGTESHFSGAIYTANNTWNQMGDDAYFGDINKAGHIGIQGKNGNTGIFFTTYNQTTKTTGAALTWDGTNMTFDKAVKLPADPQNALEAATKQYVDNSFAANDAMIYKGVLNGASSNTNGGTLITTTGNKQGHTYKVGTAGYIMGEYCETGDMIICVTDCDAATTSNYSTVKANWTFVQTNLTNAVVTDTTGGENGYLAKFSAKSTLTKGPKIGTSTTTWLNEKGEWSTPTAANVGAATSSHTHGNITNSGGMTATGAALADGDTLLFVDSSETNKLIKQTSITFDGSTTTSALSKKGTWESTVTVSVAANDTSSTGTFPVMYAATNTSTATAKNDTLKKSTGKLYFQPSTGTLTATKFSGDLSGTATNATNIRVSLNTNTKLYLLGTTSAPIDALIGVNLSACEDTGVYVTSTAGALSAVQHSYNVSGTEKAYTTYNTTDDSIDFIFI